MLPTAAIVVYVTLFKRVYDGRRRTGAAGSQMSGSFHLYRAASFPAVVLASVCR